jgi:hypothetical protein
VFQKGHQLQLQICGQDSQTEEPVWYHQSNVALTKHTLHLGGKNASYILLPVIPG